MRKRVRRKILKRAIEKTSKQLPLTYQENKMLAQTTVRAVNKVFVLMTNFVKCVREKLTPKLLTLSSYIQQQRGEQDERASSHRTTDPVSADESPNQSAV